MIEGLGIGAIVTAAAFNWSRASDARMQAVSRGSVIVGAVLVIVGLA